MVINLRVRTPASRSCTRRPYLSVSLIFVPYALRREDVHKALFSSPCPRAPRPLCRFVVFVCLSTADISIGRKRRLCRRWPWTSNPPPFVTQSRSARNRYMTPPTGPKCVKRVCLRFLPSETNKATWRTRESNVKRRDFTTVLSDCMILLL